MLAQKHALANYFLLVWILFGHTFIALAENAEVMDIYLPKNITFMVFFSKATMSKKIKK